MEELTPKEIEALLQAEDILFSHLDGELEGVFSDSAVALHIAIKKYIKLMLKDMESKDKKAIENYVESDIAVLNDL